MKSKRLSIDLTPELERFFAEQVEKTGLALKPLIERVLRDYAAAQQAEVKLVAFSNEIEKQEKKEPEKVLEVEKKAKVFSFSPTPPLPLSILYRLIRNECIREIQKYRNTEIHNTEVLEKTREHVNAREGVSEDISRLEPEPQPTQEPEMAEKPPKIAKAKSKPTSPTKYIPNPAKSRQRPFKSDLDLKPGDDLAKLEFEEVLYPEWFYVISLFNSFTNRQKTPDGVPIQFFFNGTKDAENLPRLIKKVRGMVLAKTPTAEGATLYRGVVAVFDRVFRDAAKTELNSYELGRLMSISRFYSDAAQIFAAVKERYKGKYERLEQQTYHVPVESMKFTSAIVDKSQL